MQKLIHKISIHTALFILSILFLLPLVWMISTSLKSPNDLFVPYIKWLPNPLVWSNYIDAFKSVNLVIAFKNTIILCGLNVCGTLVSSSMAAYAFAVLKWKYRDIIFFLTLTTMMLPEMVTLVPQFILFQKLQFYGTFLPLIAPYLCGNVFYIFLLRQFFLTIPRDLHEAASIDGCSEFSIYRKIYLPLSVPVLSVVALFQFLVSWNDLIKPSIYLINNDQYTLALALQQFKAQHGGTEWTLLMAAATLTVIPVILIYFFAQKTFIDGIAMTGMKE